MSGSVNKVILVGRLGADPEVRTFPSGGKVCEIRVATSERWKDRNTGENRERTEWHRVSIYNEPLVRVAEQWLRKGSLVYLEGQLETRKWQDQNGQDRYATDVALRAYRGELRMLGSRSDNQQSHDDQRGFPGESGQHRADRQQSDDTYRRTDSPQSDANSQSSIDRDDDIPF